jgi:hypothetical protein
MTLSPIKNLVFDIPVLGVMQIFWLKNVFIVSNKKQRAKTGFFLHFLEEE